ncbi:MAG: tetratricopeptide repeat protein [Bacteroidales bacterium]|nr:tetratricopeptide repeat protein [Bacteroidales bacterium]
MRFSIVSILLLFITINLFAQTNEIKAKSEFFAAQEAYDYENYKECVNHLNTTENLLGSTNPRILHLKIKAYCNLKEYSKAYEAQKIFFKKATDPNDPKYNDILKLLAEINKNAANDFVEVGKTYIDKKYYTQATKEFNKALEIDPKNISAHFYLGTTFLNTNEYDKAILAYSKARTLSSSIEDKNSRFGWLFSIAYNKAIAYENLGKYDLAIASYGNAIKVKPDKNNTYYQLACINAKQNNKEKALDFIEKAKQKGFNDFTKAENNPNLANITNTAKYNDIKNSMYDLRDGQAYKFVSIGEQIWLAENLNYKTDNSVCYADNPANCDTYGRLYTWDDAMNACPDGWHLPSHGEWKKLEMFLGMSEKHANKFSFTKSRGTVEGNMLKSNSGWNDNGNGDNTSGFSALPAGGYIPSKYEGIGIICNLWSAQETNDIYAVLRVISYKKSSIYCYHTGIKSAYASVRCIKD